MELLERVGLDPAFAKRYPAQLSGGQQQRVGVARALAADPPVMLMDEPFSAVDPVVREQLQDEFLRLQGELGKTIVFVTHDIDEAIKLGDQVAVLRVGGKLAQLATPAELLLAAGRRLRRRLRRSRPRLPGARLHRGRPTCPLSDEPTVTLGAAELPDRRDGWVLVVDEHGAAAGLGRAASDAARAPAPSPTSTLLTAAARSPPRAARLRAALDAGAVLAVRPRRGRRRRAAACSARSRAREVLDLIEQAGEPDVNVLADDLPPLPLDSCVAELVAAGTSGATSSTICTEVLRLLWDHTWLSVRAGGRRARASRCPLGWLARRYRWVYPPMMSITGLLYTIPSIALFVLIPPLFGSRSRSTRCRSRSR